MKFAFVTNANLNLIGGDTIQFISQVNLYASKFSEIVIISNNMIVSDTIFKDIEYSTIKILTPDRRLDNQEYVKYIEEIDYQFDFDYIHCRGLELNKTFFEINPYLYKNKVISYITNVNSTNMVEYTKLVNEAKINRFQTEQFFEFAQGHGYDKDNFFIEYPSLSGNLNIQTKKKKYDLVYSGKIAPHWGVLEFLEYIYQNKDVKGLIVYSRIFNNFSAEDRAKIDFYMASSENLTVLNGLSRLEAMIEVSKSKFGYAIRDEEIDSDNSLELSTKLIEYMYLGVLPLVRKTSMHIDLLGREYKYFANDINDIEIKKLSDIKIALNIEKFFPKNQLKKIIPVLEGNLKKIERKYFLVEEISAEVIRKLVIAINKNIIPLTRNKEVVRWFEKNDLFVEYYNVKPNNLNIELIECYSNGVCYKWDNFEQYQFKNLIQKDNVNLNSTMKHEEKIFLKDLKIDTIAKLDYVDFSKMKEISILFAENFNSDKHMNNLDIIKILSTLDVKINVYYLPQNEELICDLATNVTGYLISSELMDFINKTEDEFSADIINYLDNLIVKVKIESFSECINFLKLAKKNIYPLVKYWVEVDLKKYGKLLVKEDLPLDIYFNTREIKKALKIAEYNIMEYDLEYDLTLLDIYKICYHTIENKIKYLDLYCGDNSNCGYITTTQKSGMREKYIFEEIKRFSTYDKTAIINNIYPSDNNIYAHAFVHTRVKNYNSRNFYPYVLILGNKKKDLEYYIYDEVLVFVVNEVGFGYLEKNIGFQKFGIHFINTYIADTLEKYCASKEKYVWFHGADSMLARRKRELYDFYNVEDIEDYKRRKEEMDQQYIMFDKIFFDKTYNFIFVSQWLKDIVELDFGNKIVQSEVLSNPIDTNFFEFKEKRVQPEDKIKIISIKPFPKFPLKYANDIIVNTILEVSKHESFTRMEFEIIGEGISFASTIQPLLDKNFHNVSCQEMFLSQKEMREKFDESHIIFMPSREDTHGVSFFEGISSGLLGMSSRNSAKIEYVQDNVSGLLIETEDIQEYAQKLIDVVTNYNSYSDMRYRGRKYVEDKSEIDTIINKEIKLIK